MLEHDPIMYFPFRHDASVKESMLSSSASALHDSGSSARPFATSFSAQSATAPVFHHGVQGLHNPSYNMQSVPNALSTRNPGLGGGGPSSGAHQAASLPAGRFGSNNLPVGLQRIGAFMNGVGVSGGHGGAAVPGGAGSVVGSRAAIGGLGVSPSPMGGSPGGGPRIASSGGGLGGGAGVGGVSGLSGAGAGSLNRSLNSGAGGGLSVPGLNGSRVNLGSLSNASGSGLGVQGPGRPVNSMLQPGVNPSSSTYSPSGDLLAMISRGAPQPVSLLGNSFSSSPGSGLQVPSANGQLGSIGLQSDGGPNDGVAFDMNDFPQLSTRQTSGGGLQGPVGGSADMPPDMHHKEQQHENAIASIQSQHFPMGRSSGFSLGGSYVPHRQQQQHQAAGGASAGLPSGGSLSSSAGNSAADHNLHAAVGDNFQSSHGLSASYHSQVQAVGPLGAGGSQSLRVGGPPGVAPGLGSYDQLVQQYQQQQHQQHQHQQGQFRGHLGSTHQQQQLAGAAVGQPSSSRDLVGVKSSMQQGGVGVQGAAPDRFGLLGLLSVIRMSEPDLTTLALGTDLTTLGLNLNSRENLYKTFASPWADGPIRGEPEFTLPQCYVQQAPRLQPGYFAKFQQDTLFYIFYSMPNDEAQLFAADELEKRGWFYHKEHHMWFTRVPNVEPLVKTNTYERGTYYYFDQNTWETGRKENFVLHYEMLEKRPQLPAQH